MGVIMANIGSSPSCIRYRIISNIKLETSGRLSFVGLGIGPQPGQGGAHAWLNGTCMQTRACWSTGDQSRSMASVQRGKADRTPALDPPHFRVDPVLAEAAARQLGDGRNRWDMHRFAGSPLPP